MTSLVQHPTMKSETEIARRLMTIACLASADWALETGGRANGAVTRVGPTTISGGTSRYSRLTTRNNGERVLCLRCRQSCEVGPGVGERVRAAAAQNGGGFVLAPPSTTQASQTSPSAPTHSRNTRRRIDKARGASAAWRRATASPR